MLIWVAFVTFILILLALDLGVFHRRAHVVSVREALTWTGIWIATAIAFAAFVYVGYDRQWLGMGLHPDPVDRSEAFPDGRVNDARSALVKFLTGYVVELSLSVDNVFVMAMLFGYFAIPRMYQHRVLFWGILGALVMRGLMIAVGARLVAEFTWILYIFGGFLILTAVRMMFMGAEPGDPERNFVIRLIRRYVPITPTFHGERFFVRTGPAKGSALDIPADPSAGGQSFLARSARGGRFAVTTPNGRGVLMFTPLVPALVMVETTDLVFAVDSIPAIFAITGDPFLVFTSNVFAILGLRSLYFALSNALQAFRYLKHALAVVLMTVGVKMLAHSWLERVLGPDFNLYLLATVLVILGTGVLVSLVELRWHTEVAPATHHPGQAFQELVAPDHLVSTLLHEAREVDAQKRDLRAARVAAPRLRTRLARMVVRWGSGLVHRSARR